MGQRLWSGLIALALMSATATAQEPAQETPPPQPATTTTPTPAPTPTPPPAATTPTPTPVVRAVLLPVDFTVYELSAAGREAVPDWTAQAKANLEAGLREVLGERAALEVVPLPELSAVEQRELDRHLAVVKLIVAQSPALKTSAWAPRRAEFDRTLGPGLAWLRERAGADMAVFVHGTQVEQSAGLVATQLLALAAGVVLVPGGANKFVATSLLDLGTGEVRWFNSTAGGDALGLGTIDFRNPDTGARTLRKLVEPYPEIPVLNP
jgi:hypothetical protein